MRSPLAVVLFSASALAQSNAVPGTDVMAFDVIDCQVYGRRGAAHPNGEAMMNIGHSMCNSGSVHIPWTGTAGGVMVGTYPKIATLIARELNGRMTQISGLSYCKHSRQAFNFTSGVCLPCQAGPAATWRIGCSDTYSSGFSGLSSLGPTTEIDPWLGTWNPTGSYFDRGDPDVGFPGNADSVLSPISGDSLKNRMAVPETELLGGGTYWGQAQISVIGEPGANRSNNAACRQLTFGWNGTSWTSGVTGAATVAPVLTHWTNAQTAIGQNGNDDGRFMLGWKVTRPTVGIFHYEIAVHNLDNNSGGGALRIPICTSARVLNAGFKDIDGNALNQWTLVRTTNEIAWQATAGNAIEWNSIYNFWFDSDAAPTPGTIAIDRARPGPGALSVSILAEVPGLLGTAYLGDGCGSPSPSLIANGSPSIPNPNFAMTVNGQPFAITVLAASLGRLDVPNGLGCTTYPDFNQMFLFNFAVTDVFGTATFLLPIPPTAGALDAYCQSGQYLGTGPFLNEWSLSNALKVAVGAFGCP